MSVHMPGTQYQRGGLSDIFGYGSWVVSDIDDICFRATSARELDEGGDASVAYTGLLPSLP